jgi:hypothetical protein
VVFTTLLAPSAAPRGSYRAEDTGLKGVVSTTPLQSICLRNTVGMS